MERQKNQPLSGTFSLEYKYILINIIYLYIYCKNVEICYNIRYAIGSSLKRSITIDTYQTFKEYIYMISIMILFIIKLKNVF